MENSEYQALAIRTAKPLPTLADNLVHAALGVSSETGELAHTISSAWMGLNYDPNNIPEEIGDACWYAALLSDTMGWKFEDLFIDPATASDMSVGLAAAVLGRNPIAICLVWAGFAGDIVSVVKSHAIYGKTLDAELLRRSLGLYVTTASLLASCHSIPFSFVLGSNIKKLTKRYPDKYSDVAAINRADKSPGLVLVQ